MKIRCRLCGGEHDIISEGRHVKCPLVKAYEYYENGELKRIEFVTIADFAYEVVKDDFEELDPHAN